MTDQEKIEAFDHLARAMTNPWYDGQWSWFCLCPAGGPLRATREEAVADLVAWAKRQKDKPLKKDPLRAAVELELAK